VQKGVGKINFFRRHLGITLLPGNKKCAQGATGVVRPVFGPGAARGEWSILNETRGSEYFVCGLVRGFHVFDDNGIPKMTNLRRRGQIALEWFLGTAESGKMAPPKGKTKKRWWGLPTRPVWGRT